MRPELTLDLALFETAPGRPSTPWAPRTDSRCQFFRCAICTSKGATRRMIEGRPTTKFPERTARRWMMCGLGCRRFTHEEGLTLTRDGKVGNPFDAQRLLWFAEKKGKALDVLEALLEACHAEGPAAV